MDFLIKIEPVMQKALIPEAVVGSCSSKYVFLKISQISQENTGVRVSFLKTVAGGQQVQHPRWLLV